MKKLCRQCGKTKEICTLGLCSTCYHRDWRAKNPDKVKASRIRHKKHHAEYYREWYKTKGRKRSKQQIESVKMWRDLNPEKCRVYTLVDYAIKIGKIKKPKICEKCKKERKLVAHHDDYEFPFKVRWLCYSCHKILHNNKSA